MLELENIVKEYHTPDETVTALKGITLKFRKSEFVSVLGPSGCGKTTLLNIIGGLDRYTSGDLAIDGKSTKLYTDKEWDVYRNHSVGFVFQSYNLIPHQTVAENVELALTLAGVSTAERRERAKKALEKVGLGNKLNVRPNQLSGGQMQRVAIARALVNDPEIILADEPTGALDSKTSVQIMDLLKEISHERLIVMVTHNPELAEKYSSRIIRLLDGALVSDSKPVTDEEIQAEKSLLSKPVEEKSDKKSKKPSKTVQKGKTQKTSMSFLTALSLSFKNMLTKMARTILVSFAGSIGIIGIALILSLSHGFQSYIDTVQEQTLSSYPLTIEANPVDMSGMLSAMSGAKDDSADAHDLDKVYANTVMYSMLNSMVSSATGQSNNLPEFKKYLENPDNKIHDYISGIQYTYDMGFAVYTEDPNGTVIKADTTELLQNVMKSMYGGDYSSYFDSMGGFYSGFNVWQELLSGEDGALVSASTQNQYDVIYGSWPQNYNEVVLVVDKNNEISDLTLYALGLESMDDISNAMMQSMNKKQIDTTQSSWSYEDLCGRSFKLILPSEGYVPSGSGYTDISQTADGLHQLYNNDSVGVQLKIVGIVRPAKGSVTSSTYGSIGYTSALTNYAIEQADSTEIIQKQLANPDVDVFTGSAFPNAATATTDQKVAAAQAYLNKLSVDDRATVYRKCMTAPDDTTLDAALTQTMETFTRDDAKEMADNGVFEASGKTAQQMKEMIDAMDDETFIRFFRPYMRAILSMQMQQETVKAYSGMTSQEVISAISAKGISSSQYADVYDNYVASSASGSTYNNNLKKLGYVDKDSPSAINIYASSFENKDQISACIDDYNADAAENDQISYTDYVGLLMSSITTIINAISYVLIGFVAISLVVSSIMIGIITYISVLERTKEIGILRSIGASKQDISRVFNAETLIEGFTAGVMGILCTLILLIPINLIVHHLTGLPTLSAILPVLGAILLILISMALTFIAGLIPSGMAAKKDPVVALRTE